MITIALGRCFLTNSIISFSSNVSPIYGHLNSATGLTVYGLIIVIALLSELVPVEQSIATR